MREGITQKISGNIEPFYLDKSKVEGQPYPILEWNKIADKHKPNNCTNYVFTAQLESLTCRYNIKSVHPLVSSVLPVINDITDSPLQQQTKVAEFKRKYGAKSGYAIELMAHSRWINPQAKSQPLPYEDWNPASSSELLYNLGQFGSLNFLEPYVIKDSEILYSDTRYQLGVSFLGKLEEGDYIEITGGYSGSISYFEDYRGFALKGEANGVFRVSTTPVQVLPLRMERRGLIVTNNSQHRLYFRFSHEGSALAPASPFLASNESLTILNKDVSYSGGSEYLWVTGAIDYFIPLPLWLQREEAQDGPSVFVQEFYIKPEG